MLWDIKVIKTLGSRSNVTKNCLQLVLCQKSFTALNFHWHFGLTRKQSFQSRPHYSPAIFDPKNFNSFKISKRILIETNNGNYLAENLPMNNENKWKNIISSGTLCYCFQKYTYILFLSRLWILVWNSLYCETGLPVTVTYGCSFTHQNKCHYV